jgi:hypothetical protein
MQKKKLKVISWKSTETLRIASHSQDKYYQLNWPPLPKYSPQFANHQITRYFCTRWMVPMCTSRLASPNIFRLEIVC